MKRRGSIIIILNTQGMMADNFLYMLSHYKGIDDFELIFAYRKNQAKEYRGLINKFFSRADITYLGVVDIYNRSRVYNRAVLYAKTDIYIFMDMNIVLTEHCLELMAESLENDDDVLAVQPMVIKYHTALIQSTGYVFSGRSLGHALQNRNIKDKIVNQSYTRTALVSSLMAINRYVFEELQGFNETIPYEWMGREITMRITEKGYRNYYNHCAKAYFMPVDKEKNEYQRSVGVSCPMKMTGLEEDLCGIETMIRYQMNDTQRAAKYVVINFSGLIQIWDIIRKIGIKADKVVNYSDYSEHPQIEFEKIFPFSMADRKENYLYFTNNFAQIKNNPMWFDKRSGRMDLVADLTGNVVSIEEM